MKPLTKAFPLVYQASNGDGTLSTNVPSGMTLRDYFAAAALQGMLAENGGGAMHNKELASVAYDIADEMLIAREE